MARARLWCSIATPKPSEPSSKKAPTKSPRRVRSLGEAEATTEGGSRTSEMRPSVRRKPQLAVAASTSGR